jgi:large subunit ribosomal protein L10
MLLFQHNNIKSSEWIGIRRELMFALQKVDALRAAEGFDDPTGGLAEGIKLQTIQTGIFAAALKITEYYDPIKGSFIPSTLSGPPNEPILTHTLSRTAHEAVAKKKLTHALAPLLSGPLVLLTFPTVSPQHLKAALSILSPSAPDFPAPPRRTNPGYHDPTVQNGVAKLLLLGARIEGKVFDADGTRWVGGIEGGIEGLRAQLVAILQRVGAGLTGVLEGAGRSLYFTVEGRRGMLEDEGKKGEVERKVEEV